MVLQPGESTKIDVQFLMHDQMGGKHDFSLHMKTNDPKQEDATVTILSNWIP